LAGGLLYLAALAIAAGSAKARDKSVVNTVPLAQARLN